MVPKAYSVFTAFGSRDPQTHMQYTPAGKVFGKNGFAGDSALLT